MTRTIFLAWQDPLARRWYPVGRLTLNDRRFLFVYTRGALDAQQAGRFSPIPSFPDLHGVYQSEVLFPLFANRLMPASRPDFPKFLEWLNLEATGAPPLVVLARSGGQRATDTLEVVPCPEKIADNTYETRFFLHGLSHMPKESAERADQLSPGERLLLMWDFQNPHDSDALALRSVEKYSGDVHILGYCPRYLRGDVLRLMTRQANSPVVEVERVNRAPAPMQFRVLCRLTMQWDEGFNPFSGDEYRPINGSVEQTVARHVA